MPEREPLTLVDPEATVAIGRQLAAALLNIKPDQCVVFLSGDLGAGKTTLVRGFLNGLGHQQRVPSPTYTLIEPYDLSAYRVYHIDLYRLNSAWEADDLGLAELPGHGVVLLVEWPENARQRVPAPDIEIHLQVAGQGRCADLSAGTQQGRALLRAMHGPTGRN